MHGTRRASFAWLMFFVLITLVSCQGQRPESAPTSAAAQTATPAPSATSALPTAEAPTDTPTAVSATATPVAATSLPAPTSSATATTTAALDVDAFAGELMQAVVDHDYDRLQLLMGSAFVIAGWRSEGAAFSPSQAVEQLRSNYIPPSSSPVFHLGQALPALLEGADPLELWGPDVDAVRGLFVTGLGPKGQDEAILIIALTPGGQPYWHALLNAFGGFLQPTATPTASADQPVRIQFSPGSNSARLEGTVTYPEFDRYVLRALGGQTMYAAITSPDNAANFTLQGLADGQPYKRMEVLGWTWDGVLPMTQDYLFVVGVPADVPEGESGYTLDITIEGPGAFPEPTRVQFGPGGNTANIAGTLAADGDQQAYVFRALAGQTMIIEPNLSMPDEVFVFVSDASGAFLGSTWDSQTMTTNLPTTQDYVVFVVSRVGAPAVEYDYQVTIR